MSIDYQTAITEELLSELYNNIPDTEDFNSPLVGFALNAASSIYTTLKFLNNEEAHKELFSVSSLSIDSAADHINDKEIKYSGDNIDLLNQIYNHPLVVKEIDKQLNDLILINYASVIDKDFIENLLISM